MLCHVSRKYKLHDNVLSLVRQALAPVPALAARVGVTLTGFGRPAQEPVTWLADGGARAVGAGGDGEGGGADGGLESSEMPEVRTKEEVGRMLRVMSEDLGLRPRAESLAGEIEIVAAGGSTCGGGGGGGKGGGRQQEQEEEEPTLQF